MNNQIGYVSMDKYLSGFKSGDRVGGNPAVRTADPEKRRRLLFGKLAVPALLVAAQHTVLFAFRIAFLDLEVTSWAATTLVAASHVNWITGEIAPDLADVGVPVILDGAQGSGAVPVDVQALGCAAYAAAGQKWLCGTGFITPNRGGGCASRR